MEYIRIQGKQITFVCNGCGQPIEETWMAEYHTLFNGDELILCDRCEPSIGGDLE